MIPIQVDVGPGSVDPWLEIVAVFMAVSVLVSIAIAWKGLQYYGTDEEQRRQIRAVRGQMLRMTPQRVTVPEEQGTESMNGMLRTLLDRDPSDVAGSGDVTIREAVFDLSNELREASPRVPSLAVRGFVEGILILVFGSVLFLSAAWWEEAVQPGGVSPLAVLTSGAQSLWQAVVETAGLFPASETIWALVLSVVILTGEFVYNRWVAVGVPLIIGAGALAYADRATAEDLAVQLYPARLRTTGFIASGLGSIWVIGAVPYALLSSVGFGSAGTVVGGVLSGLVAIGLSALAVHDLSRRLINQQSLPDEDTRAVAGYLLVRKLFGVAVVLSLPLLLAYVGMSAVSGAALEVGAVLLAAPVVTQLVIAFAGVGVIALVATQFPEAVARVRDAGRRAIRSQAIRSWMFARGVPATAMVIAFALTWTLFGTRPIGGVILLSGVIGLWPPLLAAVVVGVVTRAFTLAWERVKYRILGYKRDRGQDAVTVDCFPRVTDADGEPLYVLRVDSHTLAHRNLGQLLSDAKRVADWYFDGGDNVIRIGGGGPPITESRYYYEEVETGRVDLDDVRKAIRGDVCSRIKATFRQEGPEVSATALEDELERDYPDRYWQRALDEYRKGGDVSRRGDHYVQHGG